MQDPGSRIEWKKTQPPSPSLVEENAGAGRDGYSFQPVTNKARHIHCATCDQGMADHGRIIRTYVGHGSDGKSGIPLGYTMHFAPFETGRLTPNS